MNCTGDRSSHHGSHTVPEFQPFHSGEKSHPWNKDNHINQSLLHTSLNVVVAPPPTPPTLISSIKILEEKTTNLLLITAKILNQASTYTVQSLIKPVHMMYNLFQTCSFQEACHC